MINTMKIPPLQDINSATLELFQDTHILYRTQKTGVMALYCFQFSKIYQSLPIQSHEECCYRTLSYK